MTNNSIQIIEERVRELFENETTGHDFHHINRVRKLALKISEKEGGDRDIIETASLLHDISDYKFNGGDANLGGETAYLILKELNLEESKCLHIKEIVDSVSYKGSKVENASKTLEAKIVQDADRLDALGAIGIARTFAYGGSKGNPIYNPNVEPIEHNTFEEYKNSQSHTINHFYEKLLLLKDKLNTNTAKKIAEKRHKLMEKFLEDFYKEWNVEL